jgi:threonine aldolase
MNRMIDLRSDTVTRPGPGMLDAMFSAIVGDDVFGDDPTVIGLENKIAAMFGHEAALFCPSGTMTNQIAVKVHTHPGDEVICDTDAHVYRYEGGGIGFNSGASVRLISGNRGRITARQVLENLNPDDIHHPVSKLVVAENTSNRGGGSCYAIEDLREISEVCKNRKLKFHLDGARLFNALVKTGHTPGQMGEIFDSISICLSKGLGAPVGSLLTGNKDFIKNARRVRKVLGGGMRQAGYLAAAGIYALDHHIERLKEDHQKAQTICDTLEEISFVDNILPVETNIIIFRLNDTVSQMAFLEKLKEHNILAAGFGFQTIRFVTHLDFTNEMLEETVRVLKKM